jgi:hypothetical protein
MTKREARGAAVARQSRPRRVERDDSNSKGCREHAHSHVWRILVCPEWRAKKLGPNSPLQESFRLKDCRLVPCDLDKIKLSIISRYEGDKNDKEFWLIMGEYPRRGVS